MTGVAVGSAIILRYFPVPQGRTNYAGSSTLLNGGLFTRDFLIEGIRDEAAWKRLDDAILANMHGRLDALFGSFGV